MAKPLKPSASQVQEALTLLSNVSDHDLDKVFRSVLDEMLILYYPPFRADTGDQLLEQAIIGARAYVDDLVEFDVETLAEAWREVRRSHRVERWPTIKVIRDACLARTATKMVDPTQQQRIKESERLQHVAMLVDQYKQNAVGDQAAREGWLLAIVEFIERHGRVPSDYEITQLQAKVEQRRKEAAGGFVECEGTRIEFGHEMLMRSHERWEAQNAELCREVLDGDVDDLDALGGA